MEFIVLFLLIVVLFVFLNIKSEKKMSVLLMEETGVPGENHRPAASSSSAATAALILFLLRRRRHHHRFRRRPPPSMHVYTLFFKIQKNHPEMLFFLLETLQVGIKFTISFI
jgi:hypothetical protein